MSRLTILTKDKAQVTMESLYQDLERRIVASPPGLCPVDLTRSFIKMCLAQSCGKCVPCRVGLRQLARLFDNVLDGEANEETVENIKLTAEGIYYSTAIFLSPRILTGASIIVLLHLFSQGCSHI